MPLFGSCSFIYFQKFHLTVLIINLFQIVSNVPIRLQSFRHTLSQAVLAHLILTKCASAPLQKPFLLVGRNISMRHDVLLQFVKAYKPFMAERARMRQIAGMISDMILHCAILTKHLMAYIAFVSETQTRYKLQNNCSINKKMSYFLIFVCFMYM